MQAYFLSHNGLGDNLFSIGALRFLCNYYSTIHFLCKDIYYEDVKLFFLDEPKIVVVPFDSTNEFSACKTIIDTNYETNDILICGFVHKSYLTSKITNASLLQYKQNDKGYDLEYDTINNINFAHLKEFYTDINLDLSILYEYFYLDHTETSKQLYNMVSSYKIIFTQTTCSTGQVLNIESLKQKYLSDENSILISTSENLYDKSNPKYGICEKFVMNKIVHYLDTIINSDEIYIIDSCFNSIILPLKKTNKLKASIIRIIRRDLVDTICV
jgi:hypothetical protein